MTIENVLPKITVTKTLVTACIQMHLIKFSDSLSAEAIKSLIDDIPNKLKMGYIVLLPKLLDNPF